MSDSPLPPLTTLNASGQPYDLRASGKGKPAPITTEEIEALDTSLIVNGRLVCPECGGTGGPCSECGRMA